MRFQTKRSKLLNFCNFIEKEINDTKYIKNIEEQFLASYQSNMVRTQEYDLFVGKCMRTNKECKWLRKEYGSLDTYRIVYLVLLCNKAGYSIDNAFEEYKEYNLRQYGL